MSNASKLYPLDIQTLTNIGLFTSSNVHPESADACQVMYEYTKKPEFSATIERLENNGLLDYDGKKFKLTEKGKKKCSKHTTPVNRYLEKNGFREFSDADLVNLVPFFMKEIIFRVKKSDRFAILFGQDICDNFEGFQRVADEFYEAYSEAYLICRPVPVEELEENNFE